MEIRYLSLERLQRDMEPKYSLGFPFVYQNIIFTWNLFGEACWTKSMSFTADHYNLGFLRCEKLSHTM
jgi:hypothetical protein